MSAFQATSASVVGSTCTGFKQIFSCKYFGQCIGCGVDHEDFDEGGREEDFGDVFGGDVDADDLGAGGGEVGVNRMNAMMINSKTPSNVISARCCESRTGKLHHLVARAVVALSREVKCLRQR